MTTSLPLSKELLKKGMKIETKKYHSEHKKSGETYLGIYPDKHSNEWVKE